jgi:RND family efflux transporter MFP subunit
MNARPFLAWLSCPVLALACGALPAAGEPADAPPEVAVCRPVSREVTDYEDFTGRTDARETVTLRARATGFLIKSAFQEGADVKKGDVLFEIDPRPYQAALEQADALLVQAQARLKRADAELERAKRGLDNKVISREEYDKTVAERAEAEAAMQAAKAARDAARLNLEFTRVTSPIDGRIGRRMVDPGNLVLGDGTALATIVSRGPLHVHFDIDEGTFLRVRKAMQDGKLTTKEWAGLPVEAGTSTEAGFPRRGKVDFADNQLNEATGTLRVRAVLPNEDNALVPGLFVRVRLPVSEPYKALLVPEEAVGAAETGAFVKVVNDKNVVERRRVVPGPAVGGWRAVKEGLKPEDWVITEKVQGSAPGDTVQPRRTTPKPP